MRSLVCSVHGIPEELEKRPVVLSNAGGHATRARPALENEQDILSTFETERSQGVRGKEAQPCDEVVLCGALDWSCTLTLNSAFPSAFVYRFSVTINTQRPLSS